MSRACYVCGSTELVEVQGPVSATCADHLMAREHIISMQTNRMVCGCGWQILGSYPRAERDRLCKLHWNSVCGAPS